jgi:hypothetical protein
MTPVAHNIVAADFSQICILGGQMNRVDLRKPWDRFNRQRVSIPLKKVLPVFSTPLTFLKIGQDFATP